MREHKVEVTKYTCEVCGNTYDWQGGAVGCEQSHATKEKQAACKHENIRYYLDISCAYDGDMSDVEVYERCVACNKPLGSRTIDEFDMSQATLKAMFEDEGDDD